jgi:hypothetical protein
MIELAVNSDGHFANLVEGRWDHDLRKQVAKETRQLLRVDLGGVPRGKKRSQCRPRSALIDQHDGVGDSGIFLQM